MNPTLDSGKTPAMGISKKSSFNNYVYTEETEFWHCDWWLWYGHLFVFCVFDSLPQLFWSKMIFQNRRSKSNWFHIRYSQCKSVCIRPQTDMSARIGTVFTPYPRHTEEMLPFPFPLMDVSVYRALHLWPSHSIAPHDYLCCPILQSSV